MVKLKVPLIVAGIACVVSMLIGLISGVRWLLLLGRGLVAGIGAGGFVLCARLILERFIPDLFEQSTASASIDNADTPFGSNINITLDDDVQTFTADNSQAVKTAQTAPVSAGTESAESGQTGESSVEHTESATHEEAAPVLSDAMPLPSDDSTLLSDLPNVSTLIGSDTSDEITTTINENSSDDVQLESSGFSVDGIQADGTNTKVMAQAIRTVLATED